MIGRRSIGFGFVVALGVACGSDSSSVTPAVDATAGSGGSTIAGSGGSRAGAAGSASAGGGGSSAGSGGATVAGSGGAIAGAGGSPAGAGGSASAGAGGSMAGAGGSSGAGGVITSCDDIGATPCFSSDDCTNAADRCETIIDEAVFCCVQGDRGPGKAGDPCTDEDDCASALCSQSDAGSVCLGTCTAAADCPASLPLCAPIAFSGSDFSYCQPHDD